MSPWQPDVNERPETAATAAAKPAAFAITEEVKKKVYEASLAIRREALQQNAVRIRNVRVPREGHCHHVRSAGAFNEEIIAFAL